MGLEILTLGSSKTYTKESLLGGGAVVGKNVTISSITPIEGGNKVTFSYTLDNGTVKTSTMDVMDGKDGVSVTGVSDKGDGTFTLLLSDGSETSAVQTIKGDKGDKGNPGDKGDPGADGYTPVKGTDYWTADDKTEIVNDVLEALPKAESEVY